MQHLVESITALYKQWKGADPNAVDILPQSGSERRYFRLHGKDGTVIGTYGANIKENDTFMYFSKQFKEKKLAVPEILAVSDDKLFYLQEDLGNVSLLDHLESKGFTDEVYGLFKKSLEALAHLQVKGDEGLDYSNCLTNAEFGKQAIMADLLYFKYYFLDALRKPYDKQKLIDDFEALSNYLTHTEYKYFMFRDFQSRNIMVKGAVSDNTNQGSSTVHFIDYQGGMKGAPQYDVASMLWQARANLPDDWKNDLLEGYMDSFSTITGQNIDKAIFRSIEKIPQ